MSALDTLKKIEDLEQHLKDMGSMPGPRGEAAVAAAAQLIIAKELLHLTSEVHGLREAVAGRPGP